MARTFELQLPANSRDTTASYGPAKDGMASVTYKLCNTCNFAVKGIMTAQPLDGVGTATVVGEGTRDLVPNGNTDVQIKISIPATAPDGTYRFSPRVGNFDQPDVDFTDGDPVSVKWKKTIPKPFNWIPVIIAAVVLLLVTGGVLFFVLRKSPVVVPALVAVPDVVGDSTEKADADLTGAGLTASTQPSERKGDAEYGTIVEQSPAAGTKVQKGTSVNITPQGVKPLTIVSYKGQSELVARAALTALGLGVEETSVAQNGVTGIVLDQDPGASNSVAPGSTIKLKISGRPDPIPMPDIVGKQWTPDGLERMNSARLLYNLNPTVTGRYTHGQISGAAYGYQQPVPPGTVVRVDVEGVNIPNVRGLPIANAQMLLTGQGFKVAYGNGQPVGVCIVTNMLPTAPRVVMYGTTITLYFTRIR